LLIKVPQLNGMPDAIHNFTTLHIAIHRPVKRTFVVFSWEAGVRKWIPYTDDLPELRLKRSSVSTNGAVQINVAKRPYREAVNIAVSSNDHYLTAGNMDIVIVKKTGAQLPAGYMKRDYPAPPATAEVEITDKELWTVRALAEQQAAQQEAAQEVPGLAALAAAAQPQQQPPPVIKTILKPIPQRIAWLIAEESSKSKETCAITTDEISPITAAVTTCFHVFEYDSIQEWVNKNPARPTCPVCREVCAITKAFQDS
jgi:hypothetical protein